MSLVTQKMEAHPLKKWYKSCYGMCTAFMVFQVLIVSDRGPQFISTLWKSMCKQLKIKVNLSTAFHPETDGQTEQANQDVERGLHTYCNYMQDDWAKWLFHDWVQWQQQSFLSHISLSFLLQQRISPTHEFQSWHHHIWVHTVNNCSHQRQRT